MPSPSFGRRNFRDVFPPAVLETVIPRDSLLVLGALYVNLPPPALVMANGVPAFGLFSRRVNLALPSRALVRALIESVPLFWLVQV